MKTISNAENILASATVEETFPQTFAIYDLNQFLAGMLLFDNPTLVFDNDDYVTIQGGRSRTKYYFSDPEITLKTAPNKKVNYPGSDIQFNLTEYFCYIYEVLLYISYINDKSNRLL